MRPPSARGSQFVENGCASSRCGALHVLPPLRDCTMLHPSRHGRLLARAVVVRVDDREPARMRRIGGEPRDERIRARRHARRRRPRACRRSRSRGRGRSACTRSGSGSRSRSRRSSRSSRLRPTAARSRASGSCLRLWRVGHRERRERRAAVGRAQRDHRARQRPLVRDSRPRRRRACRSAARPAACRRVRCPPEPASTTSARRRSRTG